MKTEKPAPIYAFVPITTIYEEWDFRKKSYKKYIRLPLEKLNPHPEKYSDAHRYTQRVSFDQVTIIDHPDKGPHVCFLLIKKLKDCWSLDLNISGIGRTNWIKINRIYITQSGILLNFFEKQLQSKEELEKNVSKEESEKNISKEESEKNLFQAVCDLAPMGYKLYRKPNIVGGNIYFSDEIGGGVYVWDTSLCAASTLIAAIHSENLIQMRIRHKDHPKNKE
jgi:hypothetical protein